MVFDIYLPKVYNRIHLIDDLNGDIFMGKRCRTIVARRTKNTNIDVSTLLNTLEDVADEELDRVLQSFCHFCLREFIELYIIHKRE